MAGIKILIILAVMILILSRKKPLFMAMVAAIILTGFLFVGNIVDFLKYLGLGCVASSTIEILVIVFLIIVLERCMDANDHMKRILSGLQGLFKSRRVAVASVAAFIGIVPSMGGALLSAPLIEQACKGADVKPEYKAYANFYYRHIAEMVLPTYATNLLAVQLSGISINVFIKTMLPFSVLFILLGLPTLKHIPNDFTAQTQNPLAKINALKDLVFGIWPIFAILLAVLVLQMSVWLATLIVLAILVIKNQQWQPWVLGRLVTGALKKQKFLLPSVLSVFLFKEVLVRSGAIDAITPFFFKLPIPEFLVMFILAFIISYLTGLMMTVMAICIPLAAAMAGGSIEMPMLMLLVMASAVGNMITPTHICLPLSVEYFNTSLGKVIKLLLPPMLITGALSILAYIIMV